MSKVKKLKSVELIELERKAFEAREIEHELKNRKLEVKVIELSSEIVKLQSLIKLSQAQQDLKEMDNRFRIKKERNKEFTGELRDKYKLGENWGYDYLTGEIKE